MPPSLPDRFRSSGGTGLRKRPRLVTTVSPDTDARLRAHSERTGRAIGQIVDDAVSAWLESEEAK